VKPLFRKRVNMTSELHHREKEYLIFMSVEYLSPHKHTVKIFHGDIKENVNGCFFSERSVYMSTHHQSL